MPLNSAKYRELTAGLGDRVTLVAVSKTKPAEDVRELYDLGQRDFGENYVQELVDKQGLLPGDIRWHFIGHLQSNKVKYIAPFVYLIQGVDSYKLLREIDKQAAKNERVIDCLLQVHIAQEETKFGFDDEELEALIPKPSPQAAEASTFKAPTPAPAPKTSAGDASAPQSSSSQIEGLNALKNIRVVGLMGMASLSDDPTRVRKEFHSLKAMFDKYSARMAASTAPGGTEPVEEKTIHGGAHKDSFRILSMGMSGDYPIAIEEGSTMIRVGSLIFGQRVYPKQ